MPSKRRFYDLQALVAAEYDQIELVKLADSASDFIHERRSSCARSLWKTWECVDKIPAKCPLAVAARYAIRSILRALREVKSVELRTKGASKPSEGIAASNSETIYHATAILRLETADAQKLATIMERLIAGTIMPNVAMESVIGLRTPSIVTLAKEPTVAGEDRTGEPWVASTSHDRVGLALSGGGIRSATFNLGLLQALARVGALQHIDYLSTVSGGGYLGGFWTAWKQRSSSSEAFPNSEERTASKDADKREPIEFRHMREFSRFLSPRVGLNEPEMWYAAAAVLGGMVPALLATIALVALLVYAAIGIGHLAAAPNKWTFCAPIFLPVTLLLALTAHYASRAIKGSFGPKPTLLKSQLRAWILVFGLAAAALGIAFQSYPRWMPAGNPIPGWMAFILIIFSIAAAAILQRSHDAKALQQRANHQSLQPPPWTWGPGVKQLLFVSIAVGLYQFQQLFLWSASRVTSAMAIFAAGSLTLHLLRELKFRREQRSEPGDAERFWNILYWIFAIASVGVGMWGVHFCQLQLGTLFEWGWDNPANPKRFVTFGMEAAIAWLGLAVCLPVLWVVFEGLARGIEWIARLGEPASTGMRNQRLRRSELRDKLASRYLAWGVVAAAMVGVWELAFWLDSYFAQEAKKQGLGVSGGLTAVFAGLFAVVRKWLSRSDKEETGAGLWTKAKRLFKDFIPAVAATAGAVCLVVFSILVVKNLGLRPPIPAQGFGWFDVVNGGVIAAATVIVGLAFKFFDPAYFGLHDFYRSRIARAYLGAALKESANRFTSERAIDDLCLTDLPHKLVRPVHLVCCASNHLTGDALPNLYRGARSGVLSQRGISLGNITFSPGENDSCVMLSAAQTASAAAFNSQMGERSIRLGRASSFLMTALNLRLGLWVQNPAWMQDRHHKAKSQNTRLLEALWRGLIYCPGTAFFRELFGHSKCLPEDRARQLHFSDGGHFENLGLYELVRRHCTYIIVSDAAQDETVAFDDLGNAIRRIREDFGVEIEIDLSPIRPNENLISQQHVAVGTIHYDGFEGSDKGTLIYIKPSLTGDESGDIQQYRTRNRQFPHESTGDQFFSEAQWESYRRLGDHIGQITFAYISDLGKEQRSQAETIFWRARSVWTVLPPDFEGKFRDLNDQARALDSEIFTQAPAVFRKEFFSEVGDPDLPKWPASSASADDPTILFYVMRILILLENAWLGLSLSRYWGHPMNDGWMNYFHRWTATPTFRRWWPILSPLFSIDFREFIKSRFDLRLRDDLARGSDAGMPGAKLRLETNATSQQIQSGHAWRTLERRGAARKFLNDGCFGADRRWFAYELKVATEHPAIPLCLQVGVLLYREMHTDGKIATWNTDEFFVPDPLVGAGTMGRFLDRIKAEFKQHGFTEIRVAVNSHSGRDPVSRALRLRTVDFYKSRHFRLDQSPADGKASLTLLL